MKRIIVPFIGVMLIFALSPSVFAHSTDAASATSSTSTAGEVESVDLGIGNPGILPTNPFYFFKEFSRGVRSFFTFNPVAKARLELKVANQKAAEIEKLDEISPDNEEAIGKALDNYNENISRLRERLGALKGTSDNPNIDDLLNKLADRASRHQQLFDELADKHKALRDRVENTQNNLTDATKPALGEFGTPAELEARLDNMIAKVKDGSVMGLLRILRFIDLSGENIKSDEVLKVLEKEKEKITSILEERSSKAGIDVGDMIDRLPGGDAVRIRVLDEVQKSVNPDMRVRLGKTRSALLDKIGESDIGAREAKRMIYAADELLGEVKDEMEIEDNSTTTIPTAVKRLLVNAENSLQRAKKLFEDGKYGAAFGLANSVRMEARVVLIKLHRLENEGGDSLEPKEPKEPVESVEPKELHRTIPALHGKSTSSSEGQALCPAIYSPVCGDNGKTYSNKCFANAAGVDVEYAGKCGSRATD